MSKLINPLQYESALEELNAVRPLQLQERPRFVLDVPILNKLPKEGNKITAGTLATCTANSLLVNNRTRILKNVENKHYIKGSTIESWYVIFTQVVYKVIITISYTFKPIYFRWVTYPDEITIQELDCDIANVCNLVGKTMFLGIDPILPQECIVDAYGFY